MSNTIPYQGDIKELPRCKKCTKKEGDHEFMTYEHPYEMKEEEKK